MSHREAATVAGWTPFSSRRVARREVQMQSRDEARAVIQTLRDYYAASNKQDVQQMVSYYHEPVMFITPRGVLTRATHAEAIPVLTAFVERLQSIGAARTEWAESHVKQLSDNQLWRALLSCATRPTGKR